VLNVLGFTDGSGCISLAADDAGHAVPDSQGPAGLARGLSPARDRLPAARPAACAKPEYPPPDREDTGGSSTVDAGAWTAV